LFLLQDNKVFTHPICICFLQNPKENIKLSTPIKSPITQAGKSIDPHRGRRGIAGELGQSQYLSFPAIPMNSSTCVGLACRHCTHFSPEGRRGGQCQQLGVPVRGGWKACSLVMKSFAPSWEGLQEAIELEREIIHLEHALSLQSALHSNDPEFKTAESVSTPSHSLRRSTSPESVTFR
jgi:hypothetical protein